MNLDKTWPPVLKVDSDVTVLNESASRSSVMTEITGYVCSWRL